MNLADRIQTLRKSKGMSQEELADKIGVSRQAISKWESEQSMPDIDKVILLSELFEVTTDYLLKGIEPQDKDKNIRRLDARIFSLAGTMLNFIAVVAAIVVWIEVQMSSAVLVGFILLALGLTLFGVGQFVGSNANKVRVWFWPVNIWFFALIPMSCAFNMLLGLKHGFVWNLSPLPIMGTPINLIFWLGYFVACGVFDLIYVAASKKV